MVKNELEAVIWDMDGVLTNTNEFHFQAWRKIYQRFSDDRQPLVRARFEAVFGMSNDETIVRLFGTDHDSTAFIETVGVEKETLFREMIRGRLEPLPGVLSWLTYFQDHGQRQAVASSAPKLNVEAILSELRLESYFAAVLSGEESPKLPSKPAPDIFLEAARRLKVPPAQCLVIEDSVVGVQAAKAASMACLAVTTTHHTSDLIDADWVIDNFVDLQPRIMLEMWSSWHTLGN
jgi:HAD superfamily hydrolase (TIGR01509 family)